MTLPEYSLLFTGREIIEEPELPHFRRFHFIANWKAWKAYLRAWEAWRALPTDPDGYRRRDVVTYIPRVSLRR